MYDSNLAIMTGYCVVVIQSTRYIVLIVLIVITVLYKIPGNCSVLRVDSVYTAAAVVVPCCTSIE